MSDSHKTKRELIGELEALRRRQKEMDCLCGMADLLTQPGVDMEVLLKGTLDLMLATCLSGVNASARIVLREKEFRTEGFREGPHRRTRPILAHGRPVGAVEVHSREMTPTGAERLLPEAETQWMDAVAERLGRAVERADAEAALRESGTCYRAFFENAPLAVGLITKEGRVLAFNEAMRRMTGYSVAELRLLNAMDIYDAPQDRSLAVALLQRHGRIRGFEAKWRRKNGAPFHVRLDVTPIRLNDQEILLTIAEDIAERKHDEKELLLARERLHYLLTTSPAIIYTCETTGDYAATFVSDNVERQLGYPSHLFLDDPKFWIDHIHPDDRERVLNDLPRLFERGTYAYEYRFQHRDGSYRWMLDDMTLVRDGAEPIEIVGCWTDITERKQAEEALEQERERLSMILDGNPIPTFVIDQNHKVILWNKACELLTGHPKRIALGKPINSSVFYDGPPRPLLADLVLDMDEELLDRVYGGKALARDTSMPHAFSATDRLRTGGKERHLYFVAARLEDRNGTPIGAIETLQDITGRVAAEDALRQSEERYRGIFNSVTDSLLIFGLDGRIIEANQAACQSYGYGHEEFVHLGWKDIVRVDYCHLFGEFRNQAKAGRQFYAEAVGVRKDRSSFNIEMRGTLFSFDAQPRLLAVVGDVTDRKQAEMAVLEHEKLLKATLNSTADGILAVNEKEQVIDTNARFAEMWRIPRNVLEKGSDARLLAHVADQLSDPQAFLARVREIYQTTEEAFDTLYFKDGRVFERFSCPLVRNRRTAGRVWSFRDITDRTRLEEQLRHAQRMESIGTLASGVAHNFNNILNIVVGYARLLQMKFDLPEKASAFVNDIISAAKQGAALTDQLLSLTKRNVGVTVRADPGQLVRGVAQTMMMLDSSLRIQCTVAADLPPVDVNLADMEQVLVNICLNAQDAMPNGGVITIHADTADLSARWVAARRNMSPGRHVRISIADSGVGMDADTLTRIFDPFFTTKGPGKGTGLGLSTAYHTVVSHGGCIVVESAPGKGAVFRIFLPTAGTEGAATARKDIAPSRGAEKILVVDDEERTLDVARQILEELGYTVLVARNGAEAIRACTHERPGVDLVLLDYLMPTLNGLDTCAELKKVSPGVKVLAMSGYGKTGKVSSMLAAGAAGFIQKPFDVAELSQAIRDALRKDRA